MNYKNQNKFDERQLKIRGHIFIHGYIFIAVYMLVTALISSSDMLWFNETANVMVGLGLSVALCCIEMILHEAYEPISENRHVAMSILMVALLVGIIGGINKIIKFGFVINGNISEDLGYIIFNLSLELVSVIYWIKHFIDKKNKNRYDIN